MIEATCVPEKVRSLWQELGQIPVDEDDCIEESFLHFPVLTPKEDIWHWFENEFNCSVAVDLMGLD